MNHNPVRLVSLEKQIPGVCVHRGKGQVKTEQGGGHREARKTGLTRNQPCWHFDLEFQAPELQKKKKNLFKPLSRWYFVEEALTD